jgi:hypothetical protein
MECVTLKMEKRVMIIHWFFDVNIEGLLNALQKQIDNAIDSAHHGLL